MAGQDLLNTKLANPFTDEKRIYLSTADQSIDSGLPVTVAPPKIAGFQSSIPTNQEINNTSNSSTIKATSDSIPPARTIDVIKDFDWTLSKNKIRELGSIPYIIMREFNLLASSALTSIYSAILATPDAIEENRQAFKQIGGGITEGIERYTNAAAGNTLGAIADVLGMSDESQNFRKDAFKTLNDKLRQYTGKLSTEQYGSEWTPDLIKTYGNLYTRKSTGVSYKFPYFNQEMVSIGNTFSDSYGESGLSEGVRKTVENFTSNITSIAELVQPGVYIQRPKYYNFKAEGPKIKFTLTLFNTITVDSYRQNSTLIKKLLLKNLPQRVNKVLIYPPAIYEVTIPGRAFYPYCYVDNLQIIHEGVKRVIEIDGRDEIVPDAYRLEITLASLTPETTNFFRGQTGDAGINFDERRVDPNIKNGQEIIRNGVLGIGSVGKNMFRTSEDKVTPNSTPTQAPVQSTNSNRIDLPNGSYVDIPTPNG